MGALGPTPAVDFSAGGMPEGARGPPTLEDLAADNLIAPPPLPATAALPTAAAAAVAMVEEGGAGGVGGAALPPSTLTTTSSASASASASSSSSSSSSSAGDKLALVDAHSLSDAAVLRALVDLHPGLQGDDLAEALGSMSIGVGVGAAASSAHSPPPPLPPPTSALAPSLCCAGVALLHGARALRWGYPPPASFLWAGGRGGCGGGPGLCCLQRVRVQVRVWVRVRVMQ